jgi:hypothetical protein
MRVAEHRPMRRMALVPMCGLLLLVTATPASAVKRHCSVTGDVCYGAFGIGSHVRLRITLAGDLFHRYTLCVRAPDGSRSCGRFGTWPIAHGLFQSTLHWAAHFPNKGPGRYRATWNAGAGAFQPAVTFREGPSIHATPRSVFAGQTVRIGGLAGGCPTHNRVTLLSRAFPHTHDFAGVPAVFATVRSDDTYATVVTIPSGKKARRYAITARCGGGNFGVTAHLRVR